MKFGYRARTASLQCKDDAGLYNVPADSRTYQYIFAEMQAIALLSSQDQHQPLVDGDFDQIDDVDADFPYTLDGPGIDAKVRALAEAEENGDWDF